MLQVQLQLQCLWRHTPQPSVFLMEHKYKHLHKDRQDVPKDQTTFQDNLQNTHNGYNIVDAPFLLYPHYQYGGKYDNRSHKS